MQYFSIPIGQLSEEALESRNKDIRRAREGHTQQMTRMATMLDLFHHLLESSDPFIASKQDFYQKSSRQFDADGRWMLDLSDSEEDYDSNENNKEN